MTSARIVGICLKWGLAGALVGVAANYYMYRVSLPIAPFVYQAF
jgi:hypothetical protein